MYEKLESCPSCAHPKFDNFLICKDYSVSGESFALVKCANCQLIFTNPRPSADELPKYYESDAYVSHTDRGNSLINLIYKIVRRYTLSQKTKLISKYRKDGTVLDYGCGTGDFLKACLNAGWKVKGVEPNKLASGMAEKKLHTDIHSDISSINQEEKFDVITAWHVIEHVSELRETLKHLRKRMTKGGHIIIAVPNVLSQDANHYKEHWAAYDVPRHLYHFSPESFQTLAKKAKLKLVETKPMKFDSYYVSLLSEKNLNNKGNFLKGISNGFKSNRSASKTGNYSSLIYILTK